jgi:transcriptional regulator with XRE-family HTH domain
MQKSQGSLHTHIREWRKLRGMTQEVLAEAIGAKTSGVSMMENGKQGINLDQFEQIAQALSITPEQLMSAPPAKEVIETEALRREILEIYDRLPQNMKSVYLAQARALKGAIPDPE